MLDALCSSTRGRHRPEALGGRAGTRLSAGAEAPDLMPSEQPKGEMAAVLGAGAASSGEALLVQSGSRAMLPMPGRAPVACWWARLPAGPPNRGRNCCSASECLMREGQGRNFPDKLVMNFLKAVTF